MRAALRHLSRESPGLTRGSAAGGGGPRGPPDSVRGDPHWPGGEPGAAETSTSLLHTEPVVKLWTESTLRTPICEPAPPTTDRRRPRSGAANRPLRAVAGLDHSGQPRGHVSEVLLALSTARSSSSLTGVEFRNRLVGPPQRSCGLEPERTRDPPGVPSAGIADLRSQHVQQVYEGRHGRDRHEHDHRRYGGQRDDPETAGPSREPCPRHQRSG